MMTKKTVRTKGIIADAMLMENDRYALGLYIAGMSPRSTEAVQRVTEFCEKHLSGRYDLEIVDIYQKPAPVMQEQIVAVPALIKRSPLPLRRMIGDMRNEQKLLSTLDVEPAVGEQE